MAVTRLKNGDIFYGTNMDQFVMASCMRFASAGQRASVMTGDLAPAAGALSFPQDEQITYRYAGTLWAPVPGTVCLSVVTAGSQAIPISTYTLISSWATASRNYGGWFSAGKFTPTIPGYYEFTGCVTYYNSAAGNYRQSGLMINSTSAFLPRSIMTGNGQGYLNQYVFLQIPATAVYMNGTTDYACLGAYQNGATNMNAGDASQQCYFSAKYLGA
jgi:hypothetical protein